MIAIKVCDRSSYPSSCLPPTNGLATPQIALSEDETPAKLAAATLLFCAAWHGAHLLGEIAPTETA